ncbi:MAG: Ig-like domain-containing protein [Candidatus Aminicenantales bacterium]
MMRSFPRFFLLLALALALIGLTMSCEKGQQDGRSLAASVKNAGELHVTHASPKEATAAPHEAETVVVIFDQPMAPLEAAPEGKGAALLKFEPSYSGKFRWKGTRTLTFAPDRRFPYGTEIKVTVPAGTVSLNGYSLKDDYVWTFQTLRPELQKYYPAEGQGSIRLEEKILLIFNQAVDKDRLADFISLTEVTPEEERNSRNFSVERPEAKTLEEEGLKNEPERALLLKPEGKLKPDHSYVVEVKAGLTGEEGPLGKAETTTFSFQTFKKFKFIEIPVKKNLDPHESFQITFSNEVNYKEFAEKARFEPELAIPEYYKEWDYGSDVLWLSLPFKPETEYTLRLPADLQDVFGNTLGQEVKVSLATGSYAPAVSMTTGHGLVEAYGNKLYSFRAVNCDQVYLQAARLSRSGIIPLLTQEKAFWASEKFQPRPGFYQVERPLNFKIPRNVRQAVPIDLKEILAGGHGLVFLQLDTLSQEKWNRYPKACLQVTELGLTGKFSAENNLVWVTELRTGLPVQGAEVELRDDSNKVLWTGQTDAEGQAKTPGWKALGLRPKNAYEKPPQWVFAGRGDDLAVLSSEWGSGLDPYEFNIAYEYEAEPQSFQGAIFTERGIYRAGENIHIKGILRQNIKGQWKLPSLKSVACQVQDSLQENVFSQALAVDAFGSFAFDFETKPTAALGTYQVTALIPAERKGAEPFRINETFRVEAFRPAEFEVHLRADKPSFVFGEDYSADIWASYLFGGAMAGQKVNWSLRLNPAHFSPPGYQGYIFGNQLDWWAEGGQFEETSTSRLIGSAETMLNAQGKLKVKSPLVADKEKDSVMATLEASVQSPSRRSVSNRIQSFVHRGEFYIGLKPSTAFLKRGDAFQVAVVAAQPDGKRTSQNITLKLIKREWNSVRKAGVGGRFEWVAEKVDTETARQTVRTKGEPVEAAFSPDKAGFYILAAEAEDGRRNPISTSTYVYVTGPDYVPWERDNRDIVELVADSEEYTPGQTAKILVKSPYEQAKALVTVERELILDHQILDLKGSASQISIPIKPDYLPNVFVSVLLVQGRRQAARADSNEDIGKPSFKLGYVKLAVSPTEKRLLVDLATDKDGYKPRDQVTVKFKVRDAKKNGVKASLAVAVVDVGVLNLIGYQTPDPFSRFYGQRPLSVQTAETRQYIVGQREFGEKGEDAGGGGAEGGLAGGVELAEVELRGDFRTTAYWNPSLVTDEKGEATVRFALPDNLTTFRVMAVAQTQESLFGNGEKTFRVSKPLQLLAALPRFARVGDKFQAGVVVFNFSDKRGEVTLGLESKGILLRDKSQARTIPLQAGESKEVLYNFEADKPGRATLAFRAKMGEESDGLELGFPVILPRPKETVALFSQTEKSAEEQVVIPEGALLEESDIEVQASSSALSGLKASIDYLTDYPYLCLEQRLSSILPYLVASKVIQEFELTSLKPEQMKKHVQDNLDKMADYQADSGGFKVWPDSRYDSPFLTGYAVFALIKAGQAGYTINQGSLDRAAEFLRGLLRDKNASKRYPYGYSPQAWKTAMAFALYDLALLKKPESGYVEKLFTERESLPLFGRTLLLKALYNGGGTLEAQTKLLQELLNKIKVTPSQAHFEDEADRSDPTLALIYNSNLRTTAFILQTLLEIKSKHQLLPDIARWIVEKRKAGHWHSTQENFFVFYALNDFFRTQEAVKPDFKVKIALANKILLQENFRGWRAQPAKAKAPLIGFRPGKNLKLEIAKDGPGLVYYGARMTTAPLRPVAARDEGLAVYKTVQTLGGQPLDSVKAGTVVVVNLEVVVTQESPFVVVEDPLPAGFEAVNVSLQTESQEQQRQMEEQETAAKERPWWLEEFNHVEMHDDRVLVFADSLAPGIHTFRYMARALNFGEYVCPGTKVEQMYAPEIYGRSVERQLRIIK